MTGTLDNDNVLHFQKIRAKDLNVFTPKKLINVCEDAHAYSDIHHTLYIGMKASYAIP
jgi:hypothetical protein